MPPSNFNIDGIEDVQRFHDLLRFESPKRVITVKAEGAQGKSHYVRRLERICSDADERVPAAIVDFSDFKDASAIELARAIHQELIGVDFEVFEGLLEGYDMGVWNAPSVRGLNDLRGSDWRGSRDIEVASTKVENTTGDVVVNVSETQIRLEHGRQLEAAARRCVDAFFEALERHCRDQPAVLILDTYEQADANLQTWLEGELKRRFVGDDWPHRLVLVIAGRDVPPFESTWPRRSYEDRVIAIDGLRPWQPGDIEEGFRALGFDEPPAELCPAVLTFLKAGAPHGSLVGLMLLAAREGVGG
jgi:hypothetical protein